MRKLLYSFLFISSALFGIINPAGAPLSIDGCAPANSYYVQTIFDERSSNFIVYDAYETYDYVNCSTQYDYHKVIIYDGTGPWFIYKLKSSFTFVSSCPVGTAPDASGYCLLDCTLTPETPLYDADTRTCIAPPTCETNYIYSASFSSCVPDCSLVTNLTLNSAGDTCECLPPYTTFTINALPPVCDLDSDGDFMPDSLDEFPNDSDNDGISDSVDINPGVADNTPPADASRCSDYLPLSPTGIGWQKYVFTDESECTKDYLNIRNNGSTYYISDVVTDLCFGACAVFQTQCVFPKIYNSTSKTCERPVEDACLPDPASTHVVQNGSTCYETLNCIGSSDVASSSLISCPDADNNGTPDDNLTKAGTQEGVFGALTQYGASTSSKQDTMIDKLESQLSKLTTINETAKAGNLKLNSIDGKLTVLEIAIKSGNTKLDGIATSNTLLGNQNSKLDAVIGNQLSQLTKADQSNTFLDDILTSLGDFNLSNITSILSGTDATIDYATAGLTSGMSKYSGITPFYDGTCGACPTISGVVMGKNITIFSQATIDLMPMDIFRGMIIFFFALAGIIMAFRTV